MKRMLFCLGTICFLLIIRTNCPAADSPQNPAQKIYVDPATGQRSTPPPTQLPTSAATNRLSTSSEGLKEVPVTEKPGGFKVHLGGRFQSTLTASNSPDGKPAVRCVENLKP